MIASASRPTSSRRHHVRALGQGWRRLQDHLMLTVYGGITREDIDRYHDQPETLAGLIARRTGRSREGVRAWLNSALSPWRHA